MMTTLRAQLRQPSSLSPQNGNPPAGLRAERRPPAECDGGHVPGRRFDSGASQAPTRLENQLAPDDSSKRCSRCKTTKPAIEFSSNRATGDRLNAICKPCDVERNRAYRQNNAERWREGQRRSRRRNRAILSDRDRAYRARFPFKRLADHVRAHAKRYRALGMASAAAIEARVAFYDYCCYLCGDPWEEIDHVIPLSRGGSNWPANLRPVCGPCNRRKWAKPLAEMRRST